MSAVSSLATVPSTKTPAASSPSGCLPPSGVSSSNSTLEQGSLDVVRWRMVVLRSVARASFRLYLIVVGAALATHRGLHQIRQYWSRGPPDLVAEGFSHGVGSTKLASGHGFFDELLLCL